MPVPDNRKIVPPVARSKLHHEGGSNAVVNPFFCRASGPACQMPEVTRETLARGNQAGRPTHGKFKKLCVLRAFRALGGVNSPLFLYQRYDGVFRVDFSLRQNPVSINFCRGFRRKRDGGRRRIRTFEGKSQQIYSLPPLATWVSVQWSERIDKTKSAQSVNNSILSFPKSTKKNLPLPVFLVFVMITRL